MAFVAGAAGESLWATSWRTWFYCAGLWVKLALGAVFSVGLVLPAMMGAVWPRLWLIAPESLIFRFRSRGISGRGGRKRAGNSRVYPSTNRRGLARALGFSRIDPGTGAMAIRRVGFGECGKDGPLARGCELAAFGGLPPIGEKSPPAPDAPHLQLLGIGVVTLQIMVPGVASRMLAINSSLE
jgi:hypothetical protein